MISLHFGIFFGLVQTISGSLADTRGAFVEAVKRQALYYCGIYPNQYYSNTPCGSAPSGACSNGGTFLGVGCYSDYQCTPYAGGQTASCIGGCCCTSIVAPPSSPVSVASLGYCPSGQRSQQTCTTSSGCQSGQSCNNGLCCTTTGQEYNNACGGQGGLSSCGAGNVCGAFQCSTSNYCCECQQGSSGGLCTSGCQAGFTCAANGYCCASCPNGQTAYGVCQGGACPIGYTCNAGNICCSQGGGGNFYNGGPNTALPVIPNTGPNIPFYNGGPRCYLNHLYRNLILLQLLAQLAYVKY